MLKKRFWLIFFAYLTIFQINMAKNEKKTFSIIVPLFNEEENIKPLISNILKVIGSDSGFLELILVDDGSHDRTSAITQQFVENDPRIHLLQHKKNLGLGAAIRTGLQAAQGNYVLYTDADLPFDFSLIPELFELAEVDSVLTGQRLNRGEGLRRWILTKGYNSLIWLFFGFSLKDVNFACKIFPQKFLKDARLSSEGSFIDVEMLLESRRLGLKIKEYPMTYYPRERGLSTLSRPKVIFGIIREMLHYAEGLSRQKTAPLWRGWRFLQKSVRFKESE